MCLLSGTREVLTSRQPYRPYELLDTPRRTTKSVASVWRSAVNSRTADPVPGKELENNSFPAESLFLGRTPRPIRSQRRSQETLSRSSIGSWCFSWVRIDLNRRDRLPVALKVCSWPLSNWWIELIQENRYPGINLKEIKRTKARWERDDGRGTQFSIHQAFSPEI
ncbi:hypothetical protein MUK42_08421 [Musa troglodytarum]|uniref:Uncharacterized protein n=1 Tax=Musa troglodytarum TaxID=320322 RepID=A0A9E7FKC6_9LILI|nr:hypothetical protein MUK42_08421 [Musa troglodytarum]